MLRRHDEGIERRNEVDKKEKENQSQRQYLAMSDVRVGEPRQRAVERTEKREESNKNAGRGPAYLLILSEMTQVRPFGPASSAACALLHWR